jgi:hypothetical protein
MQTPNAVLTRDKALLVEGDGEAKFFGALLKHLGYGDVEIRQYKGKDSLEVHLIAFMNGPGYDQVSAFAIIRDADMDSEAAFQSVSGILGRKGLPVPKRSGVFANKAGKKVGVFIMPGSGESGMLENLCLQTVADHPIMPSITSLFADFSAKLKKRDPPDAIMDQNTHYYPKNEPKAKVQAFLSGMHKTVCTVGAAAQENYWNLNHDSLTELKGFLNNLRIPV